MAPGRIATARVAALDAARAEREGRTEPEVRERSIASIPVARYGDPVEFARVVAFLAGTGSVVRVDGGLIGSI